MAAHGDGTCTSTSACLVFVFWIFTVFQESTAETCTRTGDSYYPYSRFCKWGCCWDRHFDSPACCPTPVGLIVGCVIGGFVCVWLVALAVYCRCCRQPRPRNPGIVSYGNSGVAFDSASPVNQTSSLPPGEYAPPPSYDEVMSGQFDNPASKPESV